MWVLQEPVKKMKTMDKQEVHERVKIDTNLSGLKDGKGDLLPLGTIVLDDLWNAIRYLDGDVRFTAKRDDKGR